MNAEEITAMIMNHSHKQEELTHQLHQIYAQRGTEYIRKYSFSSVKKTADNLACAQEDCTHRRMRLS